MSSEKKKKKTRKSLLEDESSKIVYIDTVNFVCFLFVVVFVGLVGRGSSCGGSWDGIGAVVSQYSSV